MQAYLINPEERTIEAVEIDDTVDGIYQVIEASSFDVVRLDHGDVIYVDDEGLYHKRDYFSLEGFKAPLAGRGLVLGTDCEGRSTEPAHDIMDISDMVRFISYDEALEMARLEDAAGKQREIQAKEQGGLAYFYIPIAGILESAAYTESSD
jgi:hypothetical protein